MAAAEPVAMDAALGPPNNSVVPPRDEVIGCAERQVVCSNKKTLALGVHRRQDHESKGLQGQAFIDAANELRWGCR